MGKLGIPGNPFHDVLSGLDLSLEQGARGLLFVGLGLAAGWWLYVPLHELLHALACVATGGTVSRLEIDALYGGRLLALVFPFVSSGSEYAGRLSGFSTGGSDLIYLATVLGPFVLTLWPGVWALRRAARRRRAALFGASLPFALAPFLSLPGDAYEIGSILTTRLPHWSGAATAALLRGDDVFKKAQEVAAVGAPPWGGFAAAIALGLLFALAAWSAGSLAARLAGEPPLKDTPAA